MKSVLAVAAAVALASASGAPLLARDSVPLPTQYACKLFKDVFPSNTFFANSTEYNAQNTGKPIRIKDKQLMWRWFWTICR